MHRRESLPNRNFGGQQGNARVLCRHQPRSHCRPWSATLVAPQPSAHHPQPSPPPQTPLLDARQHTKFLDIPPA
jgi:hypothetical protein